MPLPRDRRKGGIKKGWLKGRPSIPSNSIRPVALPRDIHGGFPWMSLDLFRLPIQAFLRKPIRPEAERGMLGAA